MKDIELYLKNLTGKDEIKAQEVASYLIDSVDINLFKALVEKSDFLFDFVRNNVCKRIEKAVNEKNFLNLVRFFEVYSPYYDDLFASILAKHADENLTDEIFDLLEIGTNSQKSYAAKYFSYIPDTIALEYLSKFAFSDDECLSFNSAEALGQMGDDISFNIALGNLDSEDDFEQLKAVKFFVAYGRNYPISEILCALKKSKMPENIAGQVPYMISILTLLKSDKLLDALIVVDNILSGLGEILPLSEIFQFEFFEVIQFLLNLNKQENKNSGKIAQVLLKAYSKFKLFIENQEYIFDEDRDTKHEISSIYKLIQSQGKEYWNIQKHNVLSELNSTEDRMIDVLPIIVEFNLLEAIPTIKSLLDRDNEILVCEAVSSLKLLNALDGVDIDLISSRIKNENIKALILNLKS